LYFVVFFSNGLECSFPPPTMSRALTVYSRKDKEAAHPSDKIEAIMQSQGCSEPVARNLLKYGKLGIGPLAGGSGGGNNRIQDGDWLRDSYRRDQEKNEKRRPPPPKIEIKAVMTHAEKKQRLRDQEERLRMELEQREREQEELNRKDTKKKVAGLERLGPVMARSSEVDPLQPLISVQEMLAQKQVEQQEGKEDGDDEKKEDHEHPEEKMEEDLAMRRFEEKKRTPQDEAARRQNQGRKKKRRRKGYDDESSSEAATAQGRTRSESDEERDARSGAARSSSAGSSLMTEAEVKAMMNKERPKAARGSVRTKSRIQKEMAEWESAKADNAEFWKAPKFCLCYSAETTRALRH